MVKIKTGACKDGRDKGIIFGLYCMASWSKLPVFNRGNYLNGQYYYENFPRPRHQEQNCTSTIIRVAGGLVLKPHPLHIGKTETIGDGASPISYAS
jgi:hypothetical protein